MPYHSFNPRQTVHAMCATGDLWDPSNLEHAGMAPYSALLKYTFGPRLRPRRCRAQA